MTDQFTVVGLNHITAPVEIRERVAPGLHEKDSLCESLARQLRLSEVVVLATCSRFEIYAAVPEERAPDLAEWINARAGRDLSGMLYSRTGREAVRHLFNVVSGLDSWVVGESQILGQVKAAYIAACKTGTAGRTCHLAFQRAMNVGKKVRATTNIVGGIASIGGAASLLARRIFSDITEREIVVFGAGEMAETTVRHLVSKGVGSVWVGNRTYEKAVRLAESLGGKPISLEHAFEKLVDADIAVVSTGSENHILDERAAREIAKKREGRPLFLIDISLPRNVDPKAAEAEGIYLYDLDHLKEVVEKSLSRRRGDMEEAERIITVDSADLWGRVVGPRRPKPGVKKPRAGRCS